MDTIRKETLFSWIWRKIHKDNLPPPPLLLLLFFTYNRLKTYKKIFFCCIDTNYSIFESKSTVL